MVRFRSAAIISSGVKFPEVSIPLWFDSDEQQRIARKKEEEEVSIPLWFDSDQQ